MRYALLALFIAAVPVFKSLTNTALPTAVRVVVGEVLEGAATRRERRRGGHRTQGSAAVRHKSHQRGTETHQTARTEGNPRRMAARATR